jgi:hypothetical protein
MTDSASNGQILTGTSLPELRRTAFARANTVAAHHPGSVLYLTADTTAEDQIRDTWTESGGALEIQIRTLDDVVDHAYDQTVTASQPTYYTRSHHRQVVDAALHQLPPDHRFAPTTPPMSNSHLQQLQDLLTLTEFAGLLTADTLRERLQEEGLQPLASELANLKDAFEDARDTPVDGIDRSLRAERYNRVASDSDPVEVYPEVDAVILGEFDRFSPVEADIIEWISRPFPTYAILPGSPNRTHPRWESTRHSHKSGGPTLTDSVSLQPTSHPIKKPPRPSTPPYSADSTARSTTKMVPHR